MKFFDQNVNDSLGQWPCNNIIPMSFEPRLLGLLCLIQWLTVCPKIRSGWNWNKGKYDILKLCIVMKSVDSIEVVIKQLVNTVWQI